MGRHATPTAAYWSFFEHFNAKDPVGWAAAMSYPHVRVSAAPASRQQQAVARTAAGVYPTADDYAQMMAEVGWERFEATGWVRTQGVTPRVVHTSPDKVHLAGGWTRHRADDSEIISNRVLYVMTRTDGGSDSGGGWGIQARFGTDSWSRTDDLSASGEAAVAAVEDMAALLNRGDHQQLAERLAYPFTIVEVGSVRRIENAAEQLADSSGRELDAVSGSAQIVQAGRSGATVAWTLCEHGVERDEILLMIERGGEWQLAAASAMPAAS